MPEYESCPWETATHVANADRSKVIPKRELSSFAYPLGTAGFWGFEPVKEKKWEWEYCGEDVTGKIGIYIDEDSKKIYRTRNATIDLVEKICRLLNEEGSVT